MVSRRQFLLAAGGAALGLPQLVEAGVANMAKQTFARGVALYYTGNIFPDNWSLWHPLVLTRQWLEHQRLIDLRLTQLKAMHVNSLCLTFPIFTAGVNASAVYVDRTMTPSVLQLEYICRAATSRGMEVLLKPLLDETSIVASGASGDWRGTIRPADLDGWFGSMTNLLLPYAQICQEQGALLLIGTELSSMELSSWDGSSFDVSVAWARLIHSLRQQSPHVRLGYSQNWDLSLAAAFPTWWNGLDLVAVDAYFPLPDLGDMPSVDTISAAMEDQRYVSDSLRSAFPQAKVYFTEVGVASTVRNGYGQTVFMAPWMWGDSLDSAPDMEVQSRYIQAAIQTYQGWGLDGMHIWRTGIFDLPDPLHDASHEFMGKPAQQTIASAYGLLDK